MFVTVTKENEELKKRMSGVEEMVANLIVDQQAMAKAFQERGDRHSGSLERHRADLNTARKDIICLKDNQSSICQEHGIFRTFSCYFSRLSMMFYPSAILFSPFHSSKKRQYACY